MEETSAIKREATVTDRATQDVEMMVDRLENVYGFECPGGPLKHCVEWIALKAELSSLRSQVETLRGYTNHKPDCDIGMNRHDDDDCVCGHPALRHWSAAEQDCRAWGCPCKAYRMRAPVKCSCGLSAALGKDSR